MSVVVEMRLHPRRPAPAAGELQIHRAVVELLNRAARPGVAWTHMPAGELRDPAVAGKLAGMGTKPGWPDLLLIKGGRLYGLELKRVDGRVSPAQVRAHGNLLLAGAVVAVARGLDEAIAKLKEWEMIR